MKTPVRIIIVGMGIRSEIYARESLVSPELFKVVGVVDINPERVRHARELFDIPEENCFSSVEDLVAVPRFADAVINGTMDRIHVQTTVPLLEHGYDVLLEKPFALNCEEADILLSCAQKCGRKVMICHVLRYAPFYRQIHDVIKSGQIGRIMNIRMAEQISYFHESVSYVRGKYASPQICGSGLLLSKSCHDIDLMAWLMSDTVPAAVSSVGSIFQFKPEMAPEGAGTHCLHDCAIEKDCPYSAKLLYLENPQRWANNIWHDSEYDNITEEQKWEYMGRPENLYSRCVYRCGQQIVDHQAVLIQFADGATGTFSLNGGAPASGRHIHVTGTLGEIIGTFEDEYFEVRKIAPSLPGGRSVEKIQVVHAEGGEAHGGGDQAVIRDFIALVRGEETSPCCTTLQDSVVGHRIVFMAEQSREMGGQLMQY
ncbi:MAG: Gfo/Idh/MocA family oxidoreductase [Lachnospiraceae bacterium]|nr:Gfo/Idh/MocA family oxidoreductase [Lachnospiraceae bacterium]